MGGYTLGLREPANGPRRVANLRGVGQPPQRFRELPILSTTAFAVLIDNAKLSKAPMRATTWSCSLIEASRSRNSVCLRANVSWWMSSLNRMLSSRSCCWTRSVSCRCLSARCDSDSASASRVSEANTRRNQSRTSSFSTLHLVEDGQHLFFEFGFTPAIGLGGLLWFSKPRNQVQQLLAVQPLVGVARHFRIVFVVGISNLQSEFFQIAFCERMT
jgi:hypothetical protein